MARVLHIAIGRRRMLLRVSRDHIPGTAGLIGDDSAAGGRCGDGFWIAKSFFFLILGLQPQACLALGQHLGFYEILQ